MRKPLILKQRKTVLTILTTMSDADLYYVMGVCNGLIQSRQAKKDELLGKKPSALVQTQETSHEPLPSD